MRAALYPPLARIANGWAQRLDQATRYPASHAEFLDQCHAAGQTRPTPLLLQYVTGDFNCLHQDLYGALAFPLQVAVLLSKPGQDFSGGEFVLTEQRPRMQSRAEVVALTRALKGDSQKRGAWGEMILERILEESGLERGLHYNIQSSCC